MGDANGTTTGFDAAGLTDLEFTVLDACREATVRQQEVLPLLARTLGVADGEVFYTWMARRIKQHWQLGESGWSGFFHGYECDLEHADGRLLRLNFGPGGRVDVCDSWCVLRFVMTSAAPWPEYPELKSLFAEPGPGTNRFGGNTRAINAVWDKLDARGAFQPADRALVEFRDRHTTIGPDGLRYVRFPPGTPERVQFDSAVASRPVLSPVGLRLLETHHAAGHAIP